MPISKPVAVILLAVALAFPAFANEKIASEVPCPADVTDWLLDHAIPFDT